ncbi:MAG TPA: MFS transporter [Acidocella sp.]|jgi:DHA2 family multidrug resistance protein-like MFS transporter|nr:MFS transporter [Acidocella sp.]
MPRLVPLDGLPPGRRGWAATAQLLGVAMSTLDLAIANTALPTIAGNLHTNPEASIWIINAYQLALIATALPFATLGDIVGHKRIFLYGLVVFTAASLACACSDSLATLTIARVFQGLGGSAMMSVNSALIRFIYPRSELGRGMGMNVLVVATAFAVGPTAASLILSVGTWPLLFAINVPLGIFAFVLGIRTLPATPRGTYRFDIILAALNAGAFGFLVLGLSGAAHGDSGKIAIFEVILGLMFGTLLLRRQARHAAPMLPVDLFKIPIFSLSALTAVCSFATQGLAFVALPFYLEQVLGRSQIETGFLITPWPIMVALTANLAGRLSDRYSAGMLGGVGLATLCVGMALLALLPAHPSSFDIVWRMAICGIGFGFFQSPNLKLLMASAPPNRAGGASGIVTVARLMGQTLGAALVALCFSLSFTLGHAPILALGLGAAFAGAASAASFARVLVPLRAEGVAD